MSRLNLKMDEEYGIKESEVIFLASKYDHTHQNILEKAIDLFCENGYEATSIEQICAALNISRATFYYHFTSKDQLIEEYFVCYKGSLTQERMQWILAGETACEKVIRTQLAFCDDESDRKLVQLFITRSKYHLSHPGAENLARFDWMKSMLLPLIDQAQRVGEIRNTTDSAQLSETAVVLFLGNRYMWCISNGAFERGEALRQTLENLYDIPPELRRAGASTVLADKA